MKARIHHSFSTKPNCEIVNCVYNSINGNSMIKTNTNKEQFISSS